MNAAIDLALHPPTVLCERCQTINLTEWFYPTSEARDRSRILCDLELATTLENQQRCTFCAFIMCALALDPSFSLMIRGSPDVVAGKMSVHSIPIGTVTLSRSSVSDQADWPDGRQGWQQNGQTLERTVSSIQLGSQITDEAGKRVKKALPSISIAPMCTVDNILQNSPPKHVLQLTVAQHGLRSFENDGLAGEMHSADQISGGVFRTIVLLGSPKQIRPPLQLNSQTQEYLERNGGLSEILSMLPQMIQDAIQLTRDLNCRYLWIDALCIVQDDSSHKISQIRQMDVIYSHAMITIVAAAGIDAWHGLPGLNEGTRFTRSLSHKIGDIMLLAKWPSTYFPSTVPPHWPWNTRAWTFQEQICSKRLLIFTNEEVMWECNNELLTEGANSSSASCLSHVSVNLSQNRIIGMKPDTTSSPLQLYSFYLAGVSSRRLGYEEDRLDCATGLLNTLQASFPSGFFWGLPIDIFDCAMLFHCGVWDKAPFKRRRMFPSWCWAAHMCHARSSITGPYWSGSISAFKAEYDSFRTEENASWIRKEVAFHRINEDGLAWVDLHSSQINDDESVFYRTSVEQWQTSKPEVLLIETKSRLDVLKIQQSHALAGFIQIIDLNVDRSEKDHFHFNGPGGSWPSWGYSVRTLSGQYICGLQMTHDYRATQPDKLTFILVAQQHRWKDLLGPLFELILVEQKGGLTFRIQIGCESMLTIDLWKQLAPRWEFVILV